MRKKVKDNYWCHKRFLNPFPRWSIRTHWSPRPGADLSASRVLCHAIRRDLFRSSGCAMHRRPFWDARLPARTISRKSSVNCRSSTKLRCRPMRHSNMFRPTLNVDGCVKSREGFSEERYKCSEWINESTNFTYMYVLKLPVVANNTCIRTPADDELTFARNCQKLNC